MGRRRLYDEDVHEVFSFFGVEVAIYFEAIRYRQQLTPGQFFQFTREDIRKRTDLTFKQQARVRRVLEATEWVETKRGYQKKGGTVTCFQLTEMAKDLIKKTPRKRDMSELKGKYFIGVPAYA
jgi:hypothetical protein